MNRFRRKPGQKGFTMIELMVVVIVVAVLAAIAIPLYGRYIRNARLTEATGRIGEVVTASKAWAQENQNATGDPMWPTAAGGIVDLTATPNFTYTIQATNPATTGPLVITATGQNQMANVTVTVTVPTINANGNPPVITGL